MNFCPLIEFDSALNAQGPQLLHSIFLFCNAFCTDDVRGTTHNRTPGLHNQPLTCCSQLLLPCGKDSMGTELWSRFSQSKGLSGMLPQNSFWTDIPIPEKPLQPNNPLISQSPTCYKATGTQPAAGAKTSPSNLYHYGYIRALSLDSAPQRSGRFNHHGLLQPPARWQVHISGNTPGEMDHTPANVRRQTLEAGYHPSTFQWSHDPPHSGQSHHLHFPHKKWDKGCGGPS